MCACVHVVCCANTTVTVTLIMFFILITELGSQPEQIYTFDFGRLSHAAVKTYNRWLMMTDDFQTSVDASISHTSSPDTKQSLELPLW